MSVVVEYDCDVKASTKRTWAYISDFARMPDWDPAIVESRQVTPGGIGVGTVFDMVTRFNGSTSRIRYEVTEWTPEQRAVIVGRNWALVSVETVQFRPSQLHGRTVVTWRAEIRFRLLLRWLACILRSGIEAAAHTARDGMLSAFQDGKHLADVDPARTSVCALTALGAGEGSSEGDPRL